MTRDGRTFPLDFVWRREVSQSPRGEGNQEVPKKKYQRKTNRKNQRNTIEEEGTEEKSSNHTTPQGNQEVSQTQRRDFSLIHLLSIVIFAYVFPLLIIMSFLSKDVVS